MSTGKTREYGSGSKREKTPGSGVWELRAGGRSKTFRGTSKAANAELARLVTTTSGRQAPNGSTLGELLAAWIPVAPLADGTKREYVRALKHVPVKMRNTKLAKLELRMFDMLYHDLTKAGVGAPQVNKVHCALCSSLTMAKRWKWIERNPAHGANLPTILERDSTTPTLEDLAKIFATAARPPRSRWGGNCAPTADTLQTVVWIRLALATGARRGEEVGIRWSKIDTQAGTFRINVSIQDDRTEKETKTKKGRTVPIDPTTLVLLRNWRLEQKKRALAAGVQLVKDPYVLSNTADSGTPWLPRGATQRWGRLRTRAGIDPTIRLGDMRHAWASLAGKENVDLRTIGDVLGHRNIPTSLIYIQQVEGSARTASNLVGAKLDELS